MVILIVCGLIAWAAAGAVEDAARAWRGESPRADRRGLRGYLDNRWQALADYHERTDDPDQSDTWSWWQRKRFFGRRAALARAGFRTEEKIAQAAVEHRRRLALIEDGETEPRRGVRWLIGNPGPLVLDDVDEEPEDGPTVDDYFDTAPTDTHPDIVHPTSTNEPIIPEPTRQLWGPFAPTNKENQMTSTGEITGPADVKTFHDDLAEVMSTITTLTDPMTAAADEYQTYADEIGANLAATETAAAGMRALGMDDAAQAAAAAMETQGLIQDILARTANYLLAQAGSLVDAAKSSQGNLATILTAYEAQIAVQDARVGAGVGNLAADAYLDSND